jgi:hypothetical protein
VQLETDENGNIVIKPLAGCDILLVQTALLLVLRYAENQSNIEKGDRCLQVQIGLTCEKALELSDLLKAGADELIHQHSARPVN